ncbi:probable sodium-coupled neutral amino acid transporter 6 isoform X2 [Anneissia japonica]|uniref:probable sodium-coupled neutral amino acid transporter 6 isoform X2 n=1 Tax=Anneissia japonica TaxID=1529436 RepID=UPI0014257FBD|nr:probable sodium-coupled neutral amino acid transporter 6 isoform X2 [Anneissia japonica]
MDPKVTFSDDIDHCINDSSVRSVHVYDQRYEYVDESTPLLSSGRHESSRKTTFWFSVFNLMNAILGSGILGLAFAMATSGIILFSILLVLVAFLANYSIKLLLRMCQTTGVKSYEDIGLHAIGPVGKILAASAIMAQNIGSMSSYLFIVKDELPSILSTLIGDQDAHSSNWYLNGNYLLLIVALTIIIPLACLPKIGFLGFTSGFSILFMLFFTVVVVVKKFMIPCPTDSNVTISEEFKVLANFSTDQCKANYFTLSLKTAYVLPTMAFSFVCHTAVLPIYCELSKPTLSRMQNVATTSIGISFVMYIISALFGYLTFYGNVESNLLESYTNSDDKLILIVRFAVVLAIVLTVPLVHYPTRKALLMVVNMLFPGTTGFSWFRHLAATGVLMSIGLCLAIFVPDLKEIFGFVGAIASSSLVFTLPAFFYLYLGKEPRLSRQKIQALLLFITGIILMLTSLGVIIDGILNGN